MQRGSFEEEYLNGKRWNGKGKEYNREGSLKFKGEYIKMPENMFSILVIFL